MAELFEPGIDYTRWCRRVHGALTADPDARMLFESTIREPRERLFEVLDSRFPEAVAERYESVFAHGNRFLARAIAGRYGVARDEVLCTTGATNGLAMVMRACVEPGDHVLVESPAFDLLPHLARRAGAHVDLLERQGDDFRLTAETLRAALRPDTSLVLISNLHNPTGAFLDGEELKALAFEAACVGAWLLVDEVYVDFARERYGGCAAALAPNIISTNSLSKVHGLFSLRCGWIVAKAETVSRIADASAQDEFGISKLTHAIASYLLENGDALDAHWRGVLDDNRRILEAHAAELSRAGLVEGALPAYGCMYFPRICHVDDTWALAMWLWQNHRLLIAPGEFFGAPGHIRIGFGGDGHVLEDALSRLGDALVHHGARTSPASRRK